MGMAWWWIGNVALLLVVLPVVLFLVNGLLIPIIRIRETADAILDSGVRLMNQLEPVAGLLAQTDQTVEAVAIGAVRYAGSAQQLLPPKEA
jgi:hypothetical protein